MDKGVSLIICCHNSQARLPETLRHIGLQKFTTPLSWEVVVIDNASTDDTTKVAINFLQFDQFSNLRVVHEPAIGLMNARKRGFAEAKYEYVSFIDDDNWICDYWVEMVYHIMSSNDEVGACGGTSEPVFEVEQPAWFEEYERAYAVGAQSSEPGKILKRSHVLWGAGLTVRKSAWNQLQNLRFKSILIGRSGETLSSGEDTEICLALQMTGWALYYEPLLKMKHYIPKQRLEWAYLRKLNRAFGEASVGLDLYRNFLKSNKFKKVYSCNYLYFRLLYKSIKKIIESYSRSLVGTSKKRARDILLAEYFLARTKKLIKSKNAYLSAHNIILNFHNNVFISTRK